jgi:hypothetical protein
MSAGLPIFGCEFLKTLQIPAIRISGCKGILVHQLIHVTGEDKPDRVHGVVASEPLRLKAREGVENHFFTKCQLVLHDDVDDRVS